jgi:hypothetical protein
VVSVLVLRIANRENLRRKAHADGIRAVIEFTPLLDMPTITGAAHNVEVPKEKSEQQEKKYGCGNPRTD